MELILKIGPINFEDNLDLFRFYVAFDTNHFPPLPGAVEKSSGDEKDAASESDGAASTGAQQPSKPVTRLTDIVKSAPSPAVLAKMQQQQQQKDNTGMCCL